MKLKSDMVNLIVRVEHHLCPLYCGVVDRRRIIAFLLLTISELIIIPYHIMLFLVMKESYGLSLCCLHTFVFCLLQFLVWKRKIAFVKGISSLYLLMFAKLALDSVFCINFGLANDNLSVISNLFVVFILAITALSQALYKTCTIITVGMIPMLLIYLFSIPLMSVLFSLKTIFLGFMMLVYVAVYNMSIVTKGLRQPKRMARVENKALNKPTPSIFRPQQTISRNKEPMELTIKGRHDPLIVPRAVVVVEAMCALTIADSLLLNMTAQMDGVLRFYNK